MDRSIPPQRRRWSIWLAIVLAAALLVAGGLALWGRQLAGPALRLALAEAGWAVEVLEIRSVRPGGIEFGAVRLPGEDAPAMDALRVNWSWDLLRGRVRDVRIDGLQINATYIDGEFAIAGLKATGLSWGYNVTRPSQLDEFNDYLYVKS